MIQINNAVKRYKNFELNISMELPKGRVTGIVGKNGAGKSTTIKMILGLVEPDEGSVKVIGVDSTRLTGKEKEKIGVALSESGFCGRFNLKDVSHIMRSFYREFDEAEFESQCKALGLPMDKKIQEFSTGMKAKLRVLIALSHKAKLLIVDEPTAGLDVEARNEVLDMFRAYLSEDEERSILITSHISSDLEGLCDDIILIHDGKVLVKEDTDVLLDEYGVLKVSEEQFEALDKTHLLASKKQSFGYSCITKEKAYYQENYPQIVIEANSIDDMILIMVGGNKECMD